jgi:hypothetical protein
MSRGFEVICADCKQKVVHHCHAEIEEAVVDLLTWVPETGLATKGLERAFFAAAKEFGWTAEKDSFEHPFFGTQSWSYPLLGVKDTARSFHGLIDNLVRALGFDSHAIMAKYYKEREAKEKELAERQARIKKRKAKEKRDVRYMKGSAPIAKRKARLAEVVRSRVLRRYKTIEELHADFDHIGESYLKTYFQGGINPKVNKEVVEALRHEYAAAWKPPEPKPEAPPPV